MNNLLKSNILDQRVFVFDTLATSNFILKSFHFCTEAPPIALWNVLLDKITPLYEKDWHHFEVTSCPHLKMNQLTFHLSTNRSFSLKLSQYIHHFSILTISSDFSKQLWLFVVQEPSRVQSCVEWTATQSRAEALRRHTMSELVSWAC